MECDRLWRQTDTDTPTLNTVSIIACVPRTNSSGHG
jgi:hypothetical protein